MSSFLQILGTSDNNCPTSILATVNQAKILFNIGEGTSRLIKGHIKLGKVSQLFTTAIDWSNWGGFGDLVYDLPNGLHVYGSTGLIDFALVSRYHLYAPRFKLDIHELDETSQVALLLEGEAFVTSIHVKNVDYELVQPTIMLNQSLVDQAMLNEGDADWFKYLQHAHYLHENRTKVPVQSENREETLFLCYDRPSTFVSPTAPDEVVSYALHTPDILPKFNVKRARELGVKPGPMFGILSKGGSVTLDDGTVIHSRECVIGDAQPGNIAIIAYCPSSSYLDNFVEHSQWEEYYGLENVTVIIHITPQDIYLHEKYQEWISKFRGPHSILLNDTVCSGASVLDKSHKITYALQIIDPEAFSFHNRGKACMVFQLC
eukprot:TRINITY_DN1911_c0_g1_i4.p1 TRINITY_DN1911_c0_g1~~TRINITY_DN1911_c0_g1_i4.p1  ORF type:complete len:375 (-),score=61.80 TRINITY_DN1911_c0_g1_i4:1090-2214(-)